MNEWTVLKKFFENKVPDRCEFFSSLKDKRISKKISTCY